MLGMSKNVEKVDDLFNVFLSRRDVESVFGYLVALGELSLKELMAHPGSYVAQLEDMNDELVSQSKPGEAFQLKVWMDLVNAACPDKKNPHFKIEYLSNRWLYTKSTDHAKAVQEVTFEIDKMNGNSVMHRYFQSHPEFKEVMG